MMPDEMIENRHSLKYSQVVMMKLTKYANRFKDDNPMISTEETLAWK